LTESGSERADAAIPFASIIDKDIVNALAHLQLARAQGMAGDKDGARKSYQDFLVLWKDADSNVSILREARAEYAKLQ
jgi:eukaryotic-like serine/threonine-protein kinase